MFPGFSSYVPRNSGSPGQWGLKTLHNLHISKPMTNICTSANPWPPLYLRVAHSPRLPTHFPCEWTRQLSFPCAASDKKWQSLFPQASSSPHVYRAVVVQHLEQVGRYCHLLEQLLWICRTLRKSVSSFMKLYCDLYLPSLAAPDAIESSLVCGLSGFALLPL